MLRYNEIEWEKLFVPISGILVVGACISFCYSCVEFSATVLSIIMD